MLNDPYEGEDIYRAKITAREKEIWEALQCELDAYAFIYEWVHDPARFLADIFSYVAQGKNFMDKIKNKLDLEVERVAEMTIGE